jgi:glycerol-3-phosphate dehydrogenase (NAD(P)+)
MTIRLESAGIIGAGAWGTALACQCTRANLETGLWCRSQAQADEINRTHQNTRYLAGHKLPEEVVAGAQLEEFARYDLLLLAVPAQATRTVAESLIQAVGSRSIPLIITAKGLERGSDKFLSDVIQEVAPEFIPFVLSGPSFASDVVAGLPTAVTLAGEEADLTTALSRALSASTFRIYASRDMKGAQIGGAVKNVLAIAAGICAGKQLGASAQAALIARSFAELRRLATAIGAQEETLFGLSGLGDLILTCSSLQSRNFSVGYELGRGRDLAEILAERTAVSEGVHSAAVVCHLARRYDVEMPVCEAVAEVISGNQEIDEIVARLMARPLKAEW